MTAKFPHGETNMKHQLIILLILISGISGAAEITVHDLGFGKEISIEGTIVNGDFEKFVDATIESGPSVIGVHLASSGGNAIVAMNIGQFIRNLNFTTNAPNYFELQYDDVNNVPPSEVSCSNFLREIGNCTCLSSCALIYFSGIQRNGNYIGIHRTYLEHEYLRSLSMSEASAYSRAINERLEEYLDEMGVPNSLLETMESIPSNEIKLLDKEFINRHLRGNPNDIQEWISANCGSEIEIDNHTYARLDEAARMLLTENNIEVFSCKSNLIDTEKNMSFRDALEQAFKIVDSKYIRSGSALDRLLTENNN
jgi:hypothetical protein